MFALRDKNSNVFAGLELDIDPGPKRESMPHPGDCRDGISAEEDVKSTRPTKHTAQVSCLPFSVEALMSDRRPRNATGRNEGNYFLAHHKSYRPKEFSQHLASIKSEPPEQGDCASLIPSPTKMSTSFRKCLENAFMCLGISNNLRIQSNIFE